MRREGGSKGREKGKKGIGKRPFRKRLRIEHKNATQIKKKILY